MKAYIKLEDYVKILVILFELHRKPIHSEIPDLPERIPTEPPLPYYQLYLGIWGKKMRMVVLFQIIYSNIRK